MIARKKLSGTDRIAAGILAGVCCAGGVTGLVRTASVVHPVPVALASLGVLLLGGMYARAARTAQPLRWPGTRPLAHKK